MKEFLLTSVLLNFAVANGVFAMEHSADPRDGKKYQHTASLDENFQEDDTNGEAKDLMQHLTSAISELHSRYIIHRDLRQDFDVKNDNDQTHSPMASEEDHLNTVNYPIEECKCDEDSSQLDMINLIQQVLYYSPADRPSLEEMLRDPFVPFSASSSESFDETISLPKFKKLADNVEDDDKTCSDEIKK